MKKVFGRDFLENTQKLFLIFLFVFLFLAMGGGDAEAVMCKDGWNQGKSPTIFNMGGTWYLISGKSNGTFAGFRWGGSSWVADAGIVAGLVDVGTYATPEVFNMGGTWYLISGERWGDFTGFRWTGVVWVVDAVIDAGLVDVGEISTPAVFNMAGTWYLISGERIGGDFTGFRWTGATWVVDAAIDVGLSIAPDAFTAPTVFNMAGTWYLISGEYDVEFFGFQWTGATWVVDMGIIAGLPNLVGFESNQKVFQKDGIWYLLQGYLNFGEKFYSAFWTGAKWVTAVCDAKDPAITRLEIRDSDGDTYKGGITTFDTLGNIDIEVDAVDNADLTAGSGVNNITIYWDDGAVNSHTCNFAAGVANATCSRTINLAGRAGQTIKYWATTSDWGGNTVQSPSWGEGCISVNADCTFPLQNSCEWRSFGNHNASTNNTFIFPRTPGIGYHITRTEGEIRNYWSLMGTATRTQLSFYEKIEAGAETKVCGSFSHKPGFPNWGGPFGCDIDFSSGANQKLKILVKDAASNVVGSASAANVRKSIVNGSCITCVADGSPYVLLPSECCSGNGANGFCCAVGTCCAVDGDCPAGACAGSCQLNDGTCNLATHICGNALINCPDGQVCAAGACAAGHCATAVCRPATNQICDQDCAAGACTAWVGCINHCTDALTNCGETALNCGDPAGDCPACAEDCATVGDEDLNGDADCADAACPECTDCDGAAGTNICMGGLCVAPAAEVCDDAGNKDEDCSGAANCADAAACPECTDCDAAGGKCTAAGACAVPPLSEAGFCVGGDNEDCENGIDCADIDCFGDPACCVCPPWPAAWTDAGCGGWTCGGNLMHQTRTRVCAPAGCGTELDNQCVADPFCLTCTPNGCGGGCPAGCGPAQDPDCDAVPPDPLKCLDCRCASDGDCLAIPQTCNIDVPPSCCAGCAIADPDCPAPSPDPIFKPMECCRLDKIYDDVDCVNGSNPGDPGREIVGPPAKLGQSCAIKGESVLINCGTKDWGTLCTLGSIYKAGDWLFYILLAASVLMASLSAYYFMTSAGDPQKVAASKNMLYWIGGAVALALISKVIPIAIGAVVI